MRLKPGANEETQVSGFKTLHGNRDLSEKNMTTNFQIKSLQAAEFAPLFELDEQKLAQIGAIKMVVDRKLAFPCRVSLEDSEPGDEVMLLPYRHHKTNSPYQSGGPIFVKKNAATAKLAINEIPRLLNHRFLSIRGYDRQGMMKTSLVIEGQSLGEVLNEMFSNHEIDYVHIHNAKPGCYMCEVVRA